MMNKCLDEGILQSYLDGELSPETMRAAATHIALCVHCNNAAREAETELGVFAGAFAADNSANVPTEMLRGRIDAALRAQQVTPKESHVETIESGIRERLASFAASLTWSPQWAGAITGLATIVLLGAMFVTLRLQTTDPVNNGGGESGAVHTTPDRVHESPAMTPEPASKSGEVAADLSDRKPADAPGISRTAPRKFNQQQRVSKSAAAIAKKRDSLLPGEENYLMTITSLAETIEASGDAALRPTARGEYERNIAVIDEAISESRRVVRRNPRDRDAAAFLFSAYQNKVELMSAVADQSQLAAAGR